ncbi:hypothetical protein LINPERPRIM_LOCUS36710 [Linum perenne]
MLIPNRCCLCCCNEESADHLFLHCSFSRSVWWFISSRLSIMGPLPTTVGAFVSGWKGLNCRAPFESCHKVLLHSFFWQIWLERNARTFRDTSAGAAQVAYKIFFSSCRWLRAFDVISQQVFQGWVSLNFARMVP